MLLSASVTVSWKRGMVQLRRASPQIRDQGQLGHLCLSRPRPGTKDDSTIWAGQGLDQCCRKGEHLISRHPISRVSELSSLAPFAHTIQIHRKTEGPVRSPKQNPRSARVVVGLVTTSESPVLHVFLWAFPPPFRLMNCHFAAEPVSSEWQQLCCFGMGMGRQKRAVLSPWEWAEVGNC